MSVSVNRLVSDRLSDEEHSDKEEDTSGKVSNAWAFNIPKWTKEDMSKSAILEESSFATLFPKYREKYLKECWLLVEKKLGSYGLAVELDCVEGSITVATTKKMWDPFIIIKARDMLKLLARSVPYEHAVKILDDDNSCEIIKIRGLVRNRERFIKRRQRLVGPNGATLKALELLTDCSLFVQGNTVSAVGSHGGLQQVARVIRDTMKNIHPIYNIKALMIKKELSKDPKMKDQDWSRFYPNFNQRNNKKQKKKVLKKKKEYTPFPPAQEERKEDIEMATGEYFLKEEEKLHNKFTAKIEKQKEAKRLKDEKKAKSFVAPEETKKKVTKKSDSDIDLKAFKQKIKKARLKK